MDSTFSKLPEDYGIRVPEDYGIAPGVSLGNATLWGLDTYRVDRPYDIFCRDGNAVIVFSLWSEFPVRMTAPWKFATGERGTLGTTTRMSRLEGEIVVSPGSSSLVPKRVTFVLLERFDVELGGLGPAMYSVATVLSHLLSSAVRLFWVDIVTPRILEAIAAEMGKH